jgi:cobalt-zinc-cadmium resistance protein CzcA
MPGNNYEFTQPIQMRINELISGVRADVAVKVYGDDLETAGRGRRRRSRPSSAACPARPTSSSSRSTGLPMLTITPDRPGAGALRPEPGDVQDTWPRPSAARSRASCSRATAASTSSCACRSPAPGSGGAGRPADWPLPEQRNADESSRAAAWAAAQPATVPLREVARIEIAAGPEPDQPRERQAPRGGHRQRARPRPRRLRRRAAQRGRHEVRCRPATGSTTAARSSS